MFRFRMAGALLALAALALTFSPLLEAQEDNGRLADWLPGYEIARCAFPQGKLVLEHAGDFLVLRQGDRLPGLPRVRVYEISEHRAVLFEAARGAGEHTAAVPSRVLKVDHAPDGTTRVTLLGADLPRVEDGHSVDDEEAMLVLTPDGPSKAPTGEQP